MQSPKQILAVVAVLVAVPISATGGLHSDPDTGKWIEDGFDVRLVTNIPDMIIRITTGRGGTFGEALYVSTYHNRSIYRIETDGQVSVLGDTAPVISGMALPYAGSGFGDYIYLGAGDGYYTGNKTIYRMDGLGNEEVFFDGSAFLGATMGTIGFALPGSPYGNYLYCYDGGPRQIYRIDTSGIATVFSSFDGGTVRDFIFDTTGQFGNQLLVSTAATLYMVAPDGSKTPLVAGGFNKGGGAVTPPGSLFSGRLYLAENYWPGRPCDVYAIDPNGSYALFARNFESWDESNLVYGLDGSLYMFDRGDDAGDVGSIYQVIPEPATLSLLALGGLALLRRRGGFGG